MAKISIIDIRLSPEYALYYFFSSNESTLFNHSAKGESEKQLQREIRL